MTVSVYFSRLSKHIAVFAVASLFMFPANTPAAGLILWDSFNDGTPFSRAAGHNFFTVTPDIGTEGILRYWEPGYWGGGATIASYINFSPTGRFGSGLTFNYSGNSNGWCSQDAINYPIGDQMDPEEGTIEFWYKPHFDQTDTSAVISVISGFKTNLDNPLQSYYERARERQSYLYFAYHGWSGRHYWTFLVGEHDESGNVIHETFARTPSEYAPDRFTFSADQWMHVGLVWKSSGVAESGNKTVMLFIDGVEVASTTQTYEPVYPFRKYLVIGSSTGQSFDPSLPGNNYSGASGDIDNLKIWDYAKTDFSDRFVEGPDDSHYIDVTTMSDINGNGSPELAALVLLPDGTPQVIIKDSETKELVSEIAFPSATDGVPAGVAGLLDTNGNGTPEVALLMTKASGQGLVKIRDSATGDWIFQMQFFGREWQAQAIAAKDLDLDGVSEISVLANRKDGNESAIQIRDAMTGDQFRWIGRLPAD